MTKVITIPKQTVEFETEHPVTLATITVKFTFKEWALKSVRSYPFFGKGLEAIMQGADIVKLIESAKKTLEFGTTDYDKFWKACEAMTWNPRAAQACIPFFVAVKDAEKKEEVDSDREKKKSKRK